MLRHLAAILLALPAAAAAGAAPGEAPPSEPAELMDNSFLIEEAYNQEAGVVQHILSATRDRASGSWLSTFTHEFPAPDQTHQLSVQLAFGRNADAGRGSGLGDLLLNYRLQASPAESAVAVAPRLSLIVPADRRGELGFGGWGPQVALPVSSRISRSLVTHANLGASWVPSGRSGGQRVEWVSLALGQSLVWLLHPRFNLLAEVLWVSNDRRAHGLTTHAQTLTVSPGARLGVDLPGDVQVVVGAAVPLGLGPSAGEVAVLGYLSVELPYWRPASGQAGR